MLWIRDVYTGYRMTAPNFSVPDPGPDTESKRSRIRIRIEEFKYFIFLPNKVFLSSWKNDLGYSSRIRIFSPSRIPDPAVKKEPDSEFRFPCNAPQPKGKI
jgi:hypothetical protein